MNREDTDQKGNSDQPMRDENSNQPIAEENTDGEGLTECERVETGIKNVVKRRGVSNTGYFWTYVLTDLFFFIASFTWQSTSQECCELFTMMLF